MRAGAAPPATRARRYAPALSFWRPLHNSPTSRTIGCNPPQREETNMHRKTSEPSFIDVLVPDHIGRNKR